MTLRHDLVAPLPPAEYGTEVLCAGWIPQAAAAPEGPRPGPASRDAAMTDAAAFLADFYRAQQA